MHLLYEILAERDEEKDAEESTESGAEEHLPEIDFKTENIDGRQCKDRSRNYDARAGSDALDDHILAKATLLAQCSCHTHCDDGNRNSSFKHLTHLES